VCWVGEGIGEVICCVQGCVFCCRRPVRVGRCGCGEGAAGEESYALYNCGLEGPPVGRIDGAVGGEDLAELEECR
jgi:hypothetical protein